MKNIKLISLFLIALTLIVTSCAIDNDDSLSTSGETITASLSKTGEIFAFGGDEINLDFVLSRTLNDDTLFSYTLNGVDNTIIVDSGSKSVSLSIPNIVGDTNKVVLKSVNGLNNPTVQIGSTNNSVSFISVPAPDPNAYNVVLTFDDTSNPAALFTLAGFSEDGVWLADLLGGLERGFSIPLNSGLLNSSEISPLFYAINIFSVSLSDPGYTVYVVAPDSTVDIFSGSNVALVDGFTDVIVALVDVSDDPNPINPGDKLYTFTQP